MVMVHIIAALTRCIAYKVLLLVGGNTTVAPMERYLLG